MDRTLVGGQEVRLSLCTPGTSGRSTLAALIAAQGMVSMMKGLLPEPNLAQLLTSMTNPAALQILMRPYHTGKRGDVVPLLEVDVVKRPCSHLNNRTTVLVLIS
uniref:Uncharacterized protein n=1 Tax=Anabas testudineus TaxID=64144 RepID=A0AAQ6I8H1_ANATE